MNARATACASPRAKSDELRVIVGKTRGSLAYRGKRGRSPFSGSPALHPRDAQAAPFVTPAKALADAYISNARGAPRPQLLAGEGGRRSRPDGVWAGSSAPRELHERPPALRVTRGIKWRRKCLKKLDSRKGMASGESPVLRRARDEVQGKLGPCECADVRKSAGKTLICKARSHFRAEGPGSILP